MPSIVKVCINLVMFLLVLRGLELYFEEKKKYSVLFDIVWVRQFIRVLCYLMLVLNFLESRGLLEVTDFIDKNRKSSVELLLYVLLFLLYMYYVLVGLKVKKDWINLKILTSSVDLLEEQEKEL